MRLFVALPVYGGYDPFFVRSLLSLVQNPPCEIHVADNIGDSLVSRARNMLVDRFLQTDCTHLLFLDTDLIFSPEHIARLVSHDLPVVAGLYPKKQDELSWVANTHPDHPEPNDQGLQRVRYVGTGCMLVRRDVFETLRDKLWVEMYLADHDPCDAPPRFDWFPVGVTDDSAIGRRRYLSEDWFFCELCARAGIEVWADVKVALKHVGQAIYPRAGEVDLNVRDHRCSTEASATTQKGN
jgi:hypothetical protein